MIDAKASLYQFIRKVYYELYQSIHVPVKEYSWGTVGKTGLQTPLLNGVILVENGDDASNDVGEVEAYFQRENVPFSWLVEKSCLTPLLRSSLESKGMQSMGTFPGMGIDLTNTLKDPVHDVIEFKELDEWAKVLARAFQFNEEASRGNADLLRASKSPYFHMGVKVDGKVVSTGSLLCLENCAYIYNIATLEEYRGKGYASSVTAKLLQKAKEQGNDCVALVSSQMGVSVYQQLGFESLSDFEIYM